MNKEWLFKCPECGANERIAQKICDEEKEAGRIGDNIKYGAIAAHEVPVMDQTKQKKVGDIVMVMLIFQDVCIKCGTTYTFRVEQDERTVRMDVSNLVTPRPNLPPHMPPFNFPGMSKGSRNG